MEKQKIIPCLWFDKNCEAAMKFYVDVFNKYPGKISDSRTISIQRYEKGMETPGIEQMVGKVLTGIFELKGYRFIALDGGPIFKFNPSVSFILNFDPSQDKNASSNIDNFWKEISKGGKVLMEFQKYPFSEKYGWCEDKFGLSWQLMLTNPEGEKRPFIIPSLMFVGKNYLKAEEAINFYTSVFKNSSVGKINRYGANHEPDKENAISFADFMIEKQWFGVTESAYEHKFFFNEAISFSVNCKDQEEIDRLWDKLSSVPESEQCGWLKDKFGLSWQIIPKRLGELLVDPNKEKSHKVANAMLKMHKIVVEDLEKAAEGK